MLILPTLKYQKREIVSTQKGFAMPQSDPCYTGKPDGQGARYLTAKVANDRRGGSRSRCFFSFLRQVSTTTGSRWWQHEGRNGTEGKHSNPLRSLHIPPLLLLKSDGCLIFPTKKLWTPNPPHPKMMDPNLPPNDGSRRIQRRCESGTNVSQLRGCGDPSVKMRNNYAIITPQTSHQMHPFAHKMRNFGEDGKEK